MDHQSEDYVRFEKLRLLNFLTLFAGIEPERVHLEREEPGEWEIELSPPATRDEQYRMTRVMRALGHRTRLIPVLALGSSYPTF